jgi:hypothetical protein
MERKEGRGKLREDTRIRKSGGGRKKLWERAERKRRIENGYKRKQKLKSIEKNGTKDGVEREIRTCKRRGNHKKLKFRLRFRGGEKEWTGGGWGEGRKSNPL